MPIAALNQDGSVKIYNKNTGQTLDVPPEKLADYNPALIADYQEMLKTQQSDAATIENAKAGVTPLSEIKDPLLVKKAREAGVENAIKETAKQKEAKSAKDDSMQKAQALLSVIQQHKAGKLSGKDYESAVNALASQYTASKAFEQGGKNLTATELSILSGAIPVIEKRTGNIADKAVAWAQGREVPQRGVVVDSPDELERKLKIAIATYQGKPVDASLFGSQSQAAQQPQGAGGLVQNAGQDVKGILNSILNIPNASMQTAQQAANGSEEARFGLTQPGMQINFAKGLANEANEVMGRPLEGGDIVGRAMNRAYEKPVTTAADILPFLFAGKAAMASKGAKAAPIAADAQIAEQGAVQGASGVNPAQNFIRNLTDATTGGGSKKHVMQTATKADAIPQKQVLLEENILTHPTETGRAQATAKSMQRYGKELGDVYKNSTIKFSGDGVSSLIDEGLQGIGYDKNSIKFIKNYISQQGDFNLSSGDNALTAEQVWRAAQKLENTPPKMMKNPESARAYKDLSQDAARVLRGKLGEMMPETKPLNSRYGALSDYKEHGLTDPSGMSIDRGIVSSAVRGARDVAVNPTLNATYKLLHKASKGKGAGQVPKAVSPATEQLESVLQVGKKKVEQGSDILHKTITPKKNVDMQPATVKGEPESWRKMVIEKPKEESISDRFKPEIIKEKNIKKREQEIAYIKEHGSDPNGRVFTRDIPNLEKGLKLMKNELEELLKKKN